MQLDKRQRRNKTIGLTPLIDVVFILLLFFMLSTHFTGQQSLTIRIPADAGASASLDTKALLSVKLLADTTLLMDGKAVGGLDQLIDTQELEQALRDQVEVIIDADDLVPLQSVITLTDRLNAFGFENVSMRAFR